MQKIGIGVVGWGFMGKTHTHALRGMRIFYPDMDFQPVLKSVCSRRIDVARRACEDFGFEHYTDDYRALLAREDIGVVSICTPNALHRDMVIAALEAGKHVYVDKPMCMDAREAEDICDAVVRSGRKLQVAHNNRFFPSTLRARALIDEGRIGEVLSFKFDYLHSGSIDRERPVGWKQMREGGVLLDLASHALDLMGHLVGEAEEVLCEMRALYPSRPDRAGNPVSDLGEDQVAALIRLKNGALGTLEASKIATGTDDELAFEIYGSRGALRWHLMRADYLEFFDNDKPEAPLGGERGFTRLGCVQRYAPPGGSFLPKNTVGWDRAHMHCYHTFLNAVAHDLPVSPDAFEAARVQALMDAMRTSAAERRWVKV